MANCTKEPFMFYLPLNKKYRSYMEIMASILDAVKYGDATRYSLMKHTSINYAQLKKYLRPLNKIGFLAVEMKGGQVVYRVTEAGFAFLKQYYVLQDMLLSACSRSRTVRVPYDEYIAPTPMQPSPASLTARLMRR